MLLSKNSLLAIVLFLAIIAGITWYAQFAPSRGGDQPKPQPRPVDEVLRFVRLANQQRPLHAVWDVDKDGNDARYVLESEKSVPGDYCFLFQNVLDSTAEFEMDHAACDCTHAEVCILPHEERKNVESAMIKKPWAKPVFAKEPQWQRCKKDQTVGMKIPGNAYGVLRIKWDSRKEPGNTLNLRMWFWAQPEGDVGNRQQTEIIVPVKVVQPLLFDPGRNNVDVLAPGDEARAVFHVWSATRDTLDVVFGPRKKEEQDPLFSIKAEPLDAKQRAALQADIKERSKGAIDTRVKVGYLVTVTVREQVGVQQMDQGPFLKSVPIYLDEAPATFATPEVQGYVRGELRIGGDDDRGRVQFGLFPADQPKTVVVPIYGDPGFSLEEVKKYRAPECLEVKLDDNPKGSTASRRRWDLKVTIKANAWSGALSPEQCQVVLRIAPVGGNPARLVRIPVVGNATH
jgi:hypothetical protein